jgi:hypothetical protein
MLCLIFMPVIDFTLYKKCDSFIFKEIHGSTTARFEVKKYEFLDQETRSLPLTLYCLRFFTWHSSTASRPRFTVTFCMGPANTGWRSPLPSVVSSRPWTQETGQPLRSPLLKVDNFLGLRSERLSTPSCQFFRLQNKKSHQHQCFILSLGPIRGNRSPMVSVFFSRPKKVKVTTNQCPLLPVPGLNSKGKNTALCCQFL